MKTLQKNSIAQTAKPQYLILLGCGNFLTFRAGVPGFTNCIATATRFFTRKQANHAIKRANDFVSLTDVQIVDAEFVERLRYADHASLVAQKLFYSGQEYLSECVYKLAVCLVAELKVPANKVNVLTLNAFSNK